MIKIWKMLKFSEKVSLHLEKHIYKNISCVSDLIVVDNYIKK